MNGRDIGLIIFFGLLILMFLPMGVWIYDDYVHYEIANMSIIDKWVDPSHVSLQPMCELEDHRIFIMGGFDYNHIVLGKTYQMKIFKSHIVIINERWRL